jgi:hypothetical protein
MGLAAYNYARFGSFTDFGIRHQLGGDNQTTVVFYSWKNLAVGFHLYWLLPASWSPYFPFVAVADYPDFGIPASIEDVYGLLPNVPFVTLGLATLILWFRRRPDETILRAFCILFAVATTFLMMALIPYVSYANRYMVDFTPEIILLAAIGLMILVNQSWYKSSLRWIGNSIVILLFAYSTVFNVLASFRHNELLRVNHRKIYVKMSHVADKIPAAIESLEKVKYGPVEMDVIFPDAKPGVLEPLLVTGHSFLADYVLIHYDAPGFVSIGLVHTSRGTTFGPSIPVARGVPHKIVFEMSSLYPPRGHPYFDRMDPTLANLRETLVKITLDGAIALEMRNELYDASRWEPFVGHAAPGMAYQEPFSGKIIHWGRLPDDIQPSTSMKTSFGPVRLSAMLPPFTRRHSEPLVCSGDTGRGDLIYVTYLAADKITVSLDHWSRGGPTSEPILINPTIEQVFEIDYGSLHKSGRQANEDAPERRAPLTISLNGKVIVKSTDLYWPCTPDSVVIAENPIGTSTAESLFTGLVVKSQFLGSQ